MNWQGKVLSLSICLLAWLPATPVHPGCFFLVAVARGVVDLRAGEVIEPMDARDIGRAGPNQLGGVEVTSVGAGGRLRGVGFLLFLILSADGDRRSQPQSQQDTGRQRPRLRVRFGEEARTFSNLLFLIAGCRSPVILILFLWQLSQNAMLFAGLSPADRAVPKRAAGGRRGN